MAVPLLPPHDAGAVDVVTVGPPVLLTLAVAVSVQKALSVTITV